MDTHPCGHSNPWASTPMATQIHRHLTRASTLTGTHFSSTHSHEHPTTTGTHPVHPPPWTLTSLSTHLTNTQPHHARTSPGAITGKHPLQQVPSPVGILTGGHPLCHSSYPHHRAPSPAPTHPPGPFNFGARWFPAPFCKETWVQTPRGWHSRRLPAWDEQLQLSYLKI